MPIAPHNNVAKIYFRVPRPTSDFSAFLSAAGLEDDNNLVTFEDDVQPTAVVTDDKASVDSDIDHPDDEDFHKDWTIPDAEGADPAATVLSRANDSNF
jgi:hypothetical protein